MFTGIIEAVGTVLALRAGRAGGQLRMAAPPALLELLREGDSIAVSGCCLTITALGREASPASGKARPASRRAASRAAAWFAADLAPETLRRTRFARLRTGDRLNLERPLRPGSLLSGHWVQGHVDAVGFVRASAPVRPRSASYWLRVQVPPQLLPYVAWKGSLAVDGVSLTIADLADDLVSFAIVPFTYTHTNFSGLRPGAPVNLEADILARYLERLLRPAQPAKAASRARGAKPWTARQWQAHGF